MEYRRKLAWPMSLVDTDQLHKLWVLGQLHETTMTRIVATAISTYVEQALAEYLENSDN